MIDPKIETVQQIYAAFGRGDLVFILDQVTDDVDWATETGSSAGPWYGPHKGRDELPHFFQAFGEAIEVTDFTPVAFGSNDTDVFAVVRFAGRSRTTGKTTAMELHHWFQFRDGKVARYRGTEDTALMVESLRP